MPGLIALSCGVLDSEVVLLPVDPQAVSYIVWEEGKTPQTLEGSYRLVAENARIFLLAYEVRLDALGLESGAVAPAACRPCALARPHASYVLDLTGGPSTSWEATPPPEALLDLIVPDHRQRCANDCAEFKRVAEAPLLSLPVDVIPHRGRALIPTQDSGLYSVDASGRSSRLCEYRPGFFVIGAVREEGDQLRLVTGNGQVARVELDSIASEQYCFGETELSPHTQLQLRRVSGPTYPTPSDELVGLTRAAEFVRFRNGEWSQPTPLGLGDASPALLYQSPDASLIAYGSPEVLRISGSGQTRIPLAGSPPPSATAFFRTPTFGVIVATRGGLLHRFATDRVEALRETSAVGLRVTAVAEQQGSLIYAASDMTLGQYLPDSGYCDPQSGVLVDQLDGLAALDDDHLLGINHTLDAAYLLRRVELCPPDPAP